MAHADELTIALRGRYAIERELGKGGMATVYLARDLQHDRLVALNAILPDIASASLRARLTRERELSLETVARIATQVAAALDEAHRHNILHRDVKPENILLTAGGDALLADFGVARAATRESGATLTADGSAVGTPAYMSPEQITGDRVLDGRSDEYALACVVYEALVGEPPHLGASIQHIMVKRLTDTPRPARALRPTVPPSLERSVQLTFSGRIRAPAISPDEKQLAYVTTGVMLAG